MPKVTEELHNIWREDDGGLRESERKPISFLENAGFREFSGMWVYPRTRGKPAFVTDQENSALKYLIDEWDHDGFIYREDHRLFPKGLETNQSIIEWADATFGPIKSTKINIVRAFQESVELLNAIILEKSLRKIAEECADIAIVLARNMHAVREYEGIHHNNIPVMYNYMEGLADSVINAILLAYKHIDTKYLTIYDSQNRIISLLERICVVCQTNLYDEIQDKMLINHKRQWNLTGQGTGYHK